MSTHLRATLFLSTALTAAGLASAALAQAAPAPTAQNAIEEVVVTATRQTSTVNKVALSVSAVTQKALDQQGIRNVSDLSNQVPGFTFRTSGGDNNPNLTMRGVGGNALAGTSGSAPTTGVYLDDLPMMKRNANGLLTGSGSPLPLLYDLDRVEILRGPQGTLYGGSSEGGTLRFITPQPSLTTYSGQARVGVSTISGGGMGNEEGLAIGGPIVQDKLGFRVSGFRQDRPGWVNDYSAYDGHQIASQINKGSDYSLHGTLLWQVTPSFKATVSVFHQSNYDQDSSTVRTSSPQINVPVRTFSNAGAINGVSYSFPATVFGGYSIPASTWLSNSARNGVESGRYLTASNVQYVPSPRRTIFTTPSVTLDYNWNDKLDFKSITSYTDDRTSGWQFSGTNGAGIRTSVMPNYGQGSGANATPLQTCPTGNGLVTPINTPKGCIVAAQYLQLAAAGQTMYQGQLGNQVAGPADVFGYYLYNNRRGQTTQEFRVSTIDPSMRLQFVAGAFIEHSHNHVNVGSNWDENSIAQQLRGANEAYFAGGVVGAPVMQVPGSPAIDVSTRNIDILENEQSVFADATFAVTDKFKITAGVRYSNYTQDFLQTYGGSVAGAPAGWVGSSSTGAVETNPTSLTAFPTNYAACPSSNPGSASQGTAGAKAVAAAGCPYQYTATNLKENPITPKVGASYQLAPGELLYVTYAEGQRPGGINPPAPAVQCANDLATLGLTTVGTPQTYQHDTVKSTEVGGKFRLFEGRAQVNVAAFHIDWTNVQFIVNLPQCAFSYVANAATASSDGAEIQATGRFMGFTVNGNLGYDNARYTKSVTNLSGQVLANKGDNLGVPDWTANLGVQYDTQVGMLPAYARMDYTYTGKYMRTTGPGSTSYVSANGFVQNYINGNETHTMNARVGVYWKDLEIAGYVKNLFDSREWVNLNQGVGNYYFTGNTVQPRIIGLQMNYRF
jgi:outer membrane receptor protein involved in Fe transport